MPEKIGFYVCHCGINISNTVDVESVRDFIAGESQVEISRDYKFMCSNAGQNMIKSDIAEYDLTRVVVAACSPLMHELTFRTACEEAGLNRYLFQMANIREQCAWVHDDRAAATDKAKALSLAAVRRVALHQPMTPRQVPINPRTLVVGAGIAGIQAALELADSGNEVVLVEREPTIGGQMARFDKTFPTLDCSSCILTPKMVSVSHRKNIRLLTCSEVKNVEGYMGNFTVTVKTRPRYVTDVCTSCGECVKVCPINVPSVFDMMMQDRTAIHKVFPQAVPGTFVIEKRERPPCKQACPIHQDAAGYIALVREGRFAEAAKLVRKENPLPFICGRVCYHPCESQCNRGSVDEPLAIRDLKRFLMDWERENIGEVEPPPKENDFEESVAVIGSGPAGLTAAFDLARMGYKVTVFEKHNVAGGMLAVGLPTYRCPRDILEHDIKYIEKMGVRIETGRELGKHFTLDDLLEGKNGYRYDAVFIATGAHKGFTLDVPGEHLEGVISGVDYLRNINLGLEQKTGRKVAVIGGGNTAIDTARTARREGAEVTILYRRTREEMPAEEDELADAIAEGVEVRYLTAPVEILGEREQVRGVRCITMQLGEPDASGRRRPVPVPGSEHDLEFDQVIVSISQQPDVAWYPKPAEGSNGAPRLNFTKWDTVQVNAETMQTDVPGVFAGGDIVLGPATVVEAMGQGRRAAEAMHKYLRNDPLQDFETHMPPANPRKGFEEKPHPYAPRYEDTPREERISMPQRDAAERIRDYREVNLGYSVEQAQREASRCLNCGVCVECYECERVCEPGAIVHNMKETEEEIEVGQILATTGFDLMDPSVMPQYGYGKLDNVYTSLEFERIVNATGPTGGKILLKNGKEPRAVAILHCIGSRDERYHRYCSRVCCMYALKFAHLVKERTSAEVYQFYIDMRAFGKGYEEFYSRVLDEGANVIRGRVAEIVEAGWSGEEAGVLLVHCEDTLIGKHREIPVDMVILCPALVPKHDAGDLARTLSISRSPDGFFLERHPKLDPVATATDGVMVAGACQGPKDIPDSVAQASAAAARILSLISKGEVEIDPVRAVIDEEACGGCRICNDLCPYKAITWDEERKISMVNEALCKGCGTCVAACPASAITGMGFTNDQIEMELEALLEV